MSRAAARAAALALALLTAAGLGGPGCRRAAVALPDSPPSIEGTITAVDPQGEHRGSVRIEAEPGAAAGSDKAVVFVGPRTALLDVTGRRIGFPALDVGRKARAWFTGPVRESYPVQADAATIVLEPPDK